MDKEREERLKKELVQIKEEVIQFEADLKTCKKNRDEVLEKKILRELRDRAARTKQVLFKLGLYRYPEDELVELSGGEFIDANTYYRLIDD